MQRRISGKNPSWDTNGVNLILIIKDTGNNNTADFRTLHLKREAYDDQIYLFRMYWCIELMLFV